MDKLPQIRQSVFCRMTHYVPKEGGKLGDDDQRSQYHAKHNCESDEIRPI